VKKLNNSGCDQAASDELEFVELLYRSYFKDIYKIHGPQLMALGTCLVSELDTTSSKKFWRAYSDTAAHKMKSLYMNVGFSIEI
jgi:hypothetical protein